MEKEKDQMSAATATDSMNNAANAIDNEAGTDASATPATCPCDHHSKMHGSMHRKMIIGILAAVLVLSVFCMTFRFATHRILRDDARVVGSSMMQTQIDGGRAGFGGMNRDRGGMGGGMGGVMAGERRNANMLTGVVTAVDGSSITVAGNGGTTKVTTNSTTQYSGSSSVKVNDTVRVVGTQTNGVWAVTRIVVNP